jgi:hypothetical protein
VDLHLFNLIRNSNQIVHKRGRVLGYLGGEDKKRKLGGGMNGDDMRDEEVQQQPKREKFKYQMAVGIAESMLNRMSQQHERAYYQPSGANSHQSKRRPQ